MTTTTLSSRPPRAVRIGGREYPVVLPTLRDPRLHLAAVIVSLQVLGQTVLGFELSIAQILVSILTCAVLEVGLTLWRRRILMWPASALLTGNGVAFILRVPGTAHGDWWSLRGAGIFAGVAAVSLLSKYVIRRGGRHLFNPSNLGLVVAFLVLGTRVVNPQDLWWGPLSPGLVLTLAIIVIGGLTIVARLGMLGMVAAFWATFAAATGLLAASGHCMTARWHVGQVCGGSFWWVLALSPEILVFMFFMITDPRTTPAGRVARIVYGSGVAFVAALLVGPSVSEFSTKVGVLAGLVIICALRPLLERALPVAGAEGDRPGAWTGALVARAEGTGSVVRRLVAPFLLGFAVVGFGAALLIVAGLRARSVEAAPASAATMARPAVSLPPLPPVAIDPAVRHIDGGITAQTAQRMAEDVAADLAIGADALRTRNAGLAETAATGSYLQSIKSQIDAASGGPGLPAPTYRFDTMTVVLARDPMRPQDPAKIGVAVQGTSGGVAFSRRFVVSLAGDHYLIAADSKS